MKKMLFICNPTTGGGKLKNKLMEILCLFSEAGYLVTLWPTHAMGEAREVAKNFGAGKDIVVCCGGDGTLNEVVDGLKDLQPIPLLGYIPGGTTCDFATSLQLPKGNLLEAARRVLEPKDIFRCDIGLLNGRAFNYVAAFGAFTDVSYKTPQKSKNVLGHFAYLIEGMQRLANLESYDVRVKLGEDEMEDRYLLGMVTNSVSVAGFAYPDQEKVQMDDGRFEVLLVKPPQNLGELGELSSALLAGNFSSPLLTIRRASSIRLTFAADVSWTLDGEFGGQFGEAEIEVRQKAVRICV